MEILSKTSNSMVYHREDCAYAKKIYKRNRARMSWKEAENRGYRPCKCCHSMSHLYKIDKEQIQGFSKAKNMDVDLKKGVLYVRTDVGCWKVIYLRKKRHFVLWHRNATDTRINLDEVEKTSYHRQKDMESAESIMEYLQYIQKHDKYKPNMNTDYHKLPRDTKMQKAYFNAAKKRAKKRSAKRVDMLFTLIEQQEGIRHLSFC